MATEEYSVEAFLAREQEQLAGIDDEFGALTTSDSVPVKENGDGNHVNGLNEPAIDLDLDQNGPVAAPVVVQSSNGFENGDGILENGGAQLETKVDTTPIVANTLSALPLAQQTAMRQAATPTPPPTREEPAKIKTWREQQKDRLEKKDRNEEIEKQKLREQAKRELDDWYKKRNEQSEKVKKRNRELEQELMSQRDDEQPGQEWERVAGLCDFTPKSNRAAKDLTRLRSILLQMKNQPQKSGK